MFEPGYSVEHRATVYPTLWRPKDIKGIPRDYLMFLLVVAGVLMMALGLFAHLIGFVIGFVIFFGGAVLGYALGRRDPEFLTVHLARMAKIGRTLSRDGGGNEYIA